MKVKRRTGRRDDRPPARRVRERSDPLAGPGERRDRETAVRSALGARPVDLVRLFVSEAALLSTAGAVSSLARPACTVSLPRRSAGASRKSASGWRSAHGRARLQAWCSANQPRSSFLAPRTHRGGAAGHNAPRVPGPRSGRRRHFKLNPALASIRWYRVRTPDGPRYFTLRLSREGRLLGAIIED
jgi:hypothetical protein